jgi:hypothetical protein
MGAAVHNKLPNRASDVAKEYLCLSFVPMREHPLEGDKVVEDWVYDATGLLQKLAREQAA